MAEGGEGLTPEQLIEQFRQMKVSDLLLSTLFTLSQLAYGKLEPSARDLDQARIAIDAMRALMPVVEPAIPADAARDFNQVVTNLQLAYASAVSEPAASDITSQTVGEAEPAPEADSPDAGDITSQAETGSDEAPPGDR
jgi:hypothetical protein